jgi:hypothetical protein
MWDRYLIIIIFSIVKTVISGYSTINFCYFSHSLPHFLPSLMAWAPSAIDPRYRGCTVAGLPHLSASSSSWLWAAALPLSSLTSPSLRVTPLSPLLPPSLCYGQRSTPPPPPGAAGAPVQERLDAGPAARSTTTAMPTSIRFTSSAETRGAYQSSRKAIPPRGSLYVLI